MVDSSRIDAPVQSDAGVSGDHLAEVWYGANLWYGFFSAGVALVKLYPDRRATM